jgi:hypothetical protein
VLLEGPETIFNVGSDCVVTAGRIQVTISTILRFAGFQELAFCRFLRLVLQLIANWSNGHSLTIWLGFNAKYSY